MALTAKEIYDLNNMNVAAQNVQLGTLINKLIDDGGEAADIDWQNLDEDTRRRIMKAMQNEEGDVNGSDK